MMKSGVPMIQSQYMHEQRRVIKRKERLSNQRLDVYKQASCIVLSTCAETDPGRAFVR